jgi:hypothetical protein
MAGQLHEPKAVTWVTFGQLILKLILQLLDSLRLKETDEIGKQETCIYCIYICLIGKS